MVAGPPSGSRRPGQVPCACGAPALPGERLCAACLATTRAAAGAPQAPLEENRVLGGKPRFVRQIDERKHYLVPPSEELIPLVPGEVFAMGRNPKSKLALQAGDISRQHAEIVWEGVPPQPCIAEVRSTHGTFWNGQRVERGAPCPLNDGDSIRLGANVLLTYWHVTDRELKQRQLETSLNDTFRGVASSGAPPWRGQASNVPGSGVTNLVQALAGEEAPPPPAIPEDPNEPPLEGDLAVIPMRVILESCYRRRLSGTLFFGDDEAQGEIEVVEGKAKRVVFGQLTAQEAAARVKTITQGTYRFEAPRPAAPAPSGVRRPTAQGPRPSPPSGRPPRPGGPPPR